MPGLVCKKIIILLINFLPIFADDWSYQDVAAWGNVSAICNNGQRQSPISLSGYDTVYAADLKNRPIIFTNYQTSFLGTIANNGHTASWTISRTSSNLPTISSSNLPGKFVLSAINFHWGGNRPDDTYLGSEHFVQFQTAPLEAQFLHYNTKYQSFNDAQSNADGLAILAFLFRTVDDHSNNVTNDYSAFVNVLRQISMPNSKTDINVDFSKIVPSTALNGSGFFRYSGSLTTPPCYETVSWTIFQDRIAMPNSQVQAFHTALTLKEINTLGADIVYTVLQNNYRPIQKRNSRTIWTNVGSSSSAMTIRATGYFILYFAAAIFASLFWSHSSS